MSTLCLHTVYISSLPNIAEICYEVNLKSLSESSSWNIAWELVSSIDKSEIIRDLRDCTFHVPFNENGENILRHFILAIPPDKEILTQGKDLSLEALYAWYFGHQGMLRFFKILKTWVPGISAYLGVLLYDFCTF